MAKELFVTGFGFTDAHPVRATQKRKEGKQGQEGNSSGLVDQSNREDIFRKIIPISLAALQSKNFAFSLPFNAALSDKSKAAKEAGHQQMKLLSSCSRQSRKLTEDTQGARWIKNHWQDLKSTKFRYAAISACHYKPAGKLYSLHWGKPSLRIVIMPMYGNTRPLI